MIAAGCQVVGVELPCFRLQPMLMVLGDVHLQGGQADAAFVAFLRFLLAQPAARLVILGDLFDYWVETDELVARHAAVFQALRALHAAGWLVDCIRGNREFTAGARLRCAGKLRVCARVDLHLGPRRVRIVHGDGLVEDKPYRLQAALMRGFWFQILSCAAPSWLHAPVARLLRKASRGDDYRPKPQARRRIFFLDPRRIEPHRKHCDLLVAGHVHRRLHATVRGLPLVLVGDWQRQGGPYLVLDAQGQWQRREWILP